MTTKKTVDLVKELFDMVYQWGRVGVVVDHTAPAFQAQLTQMFEEALPKKKSLAFWKQKFTLAELALGENRPLELAFRNGYNQAVDDTKAAFQQLIHKGE